MGDLGKLNVAKAFKELPKVQKIAKSGHTECREQNAYIEISVHRWWRMGHKTDFFSKKLFKLFFSISAIGGLLFYGHFCSVWHYWASFETSWKIYYNNEPNYFENILGYFEKHHYLI